MNFPVGYRDIENFQRNNPNIILKIYACEETSPHMTKKEIHNIMYPCYFPNLTPEEMKGDQKEVVYHLILFPSQEVIAYRLNKNNFDIGHIIPIVNAFLYGLRSENHGEFICDGCGSTFRTEEPRDAHINKECYVKNSNQFKLTTENDFFKYHACFPIKPFIHYSDFETNMEKLGVDDDWDEEHIPQAIESHAVTRYEHIYEMFNILLHFKYQGVYYAHHFAKYLLKIEEQIQLHHGWTMSFLKTT
jgi:hypothetical protein